MELHALARGYTLPASWYTDPAVFAREQQRIFKHEWPVGRADQVAAPGSYGAVREHWKSGFDSRGEVERGQFHFLWPNVVINIVPGRANLAIGPIVPAGPERTGRFLDYFFAGDAAEEWVAEVLDFDDQVGAEDCVLVESVQLGLRSGMVERGRLMPRSERLIADFQRRVAEALGG